MTIQTTQPHSPDAVYMADSCLKLWSPAKVGVLIRIEIDDPPAVDRPAMVAEVSGKGASIATTQLRTLEKNDQQSPVNEAGHSGNHQRLCTLDFDLDESRVESPEFIAVEL